MQSNLNLHWSTEAEVNHDIQIIDKKSWDGHQNLQNLQYEIKNRTAQMIKSHSTFCSFINIPTAINNASPKVHDVVFVFLTKGII